MITIIGTGGVTYHLLAGLKVLATQQGLGNVVLWDADRFEERNNTRQAWNCGDGEYKVIAAGDVARVMGLGGDIVSRVALWLEYPEQVSEGLEPGDKQLVVVAMVDNDLARKIAAEGAQLAKIQGLVEESVYVAAGNDREHGHGISARVGMDGLWPRDAVERHPDVFGEVTEDDRMVWEASQNQAHCGDRQDQSLISNMRTAQCVVQSMADVVLRGGRYAEYRWCYDPFVKGVYKTWKE